MGGGTCRCTERLDGKTVLVTGANTGIGKVTAAELAKRGARRMILACRDLTKAEEAAREIREMPGVLAESVVVMKLDLSDLSSVKEFAKEFKSKEEKLDILINNAGVALHDFAKTKDGLELHMGVNHFGHFLLTNLLLPALESAAPSRIVNVSSDAYRIAKIDFQDLHYEHGRPYGALKAYAQSKLANYLFTQELARRLAGKNITANALHPGTVNTEVFRHMAIGGGGLIQTLASPFLRLFFKTPEQGAQTTIHLALSTGLEDVSGRYYAACKQSHHPNADLTQENAAKLWEVSMETCKPFMES